MIWSHPIFFLLYVLVGPLTWAGMFVGFALAASRMNRLKHSLPLPHELPRVTIFVPAKDEGSGITRCIDRVLKQDYPSFDVLAIDDRSNDDTGAVLANLAAGTPKLRVMHIPTGGLPAGWLGKCHALASAAEGIESEWLLFVDSDVALEPAALSTTLACAVARKYDAVSILTRLEYQSFWEGLILPIAAASWSVMHAASLTNEDGRRDVAVANGQFFLIRRAAYEAVGGHASVRDQITEDVELMRRLKAHGYRTRLLFGAHLAQTRMHATIGQLFHGWGRIYSGTARRRSGRIIAAIVFFLVCGFSAYPALVYGIWRLPELRWMIAATAHLGWMTAYLMLIYGMSRTPRRNAVLFPLAGGIMLGIFAYAIRMCRTGRVKWRNTSYGTWQPATDASATPRI